MPIDPPYDRIHELDDLGAVDPAWAGIRVEWMDVAGARVRLLRHDGPQDGPLVLLVHGLGGSATNWLEVIKPLSELGDVVAVDLLGFGETPPPRPNSSRPVANARFLATLLHALDRGPAVVVGNSMGGLVGTLLAGEHPQLVDQLVLLGPALPPYLPGVRPSKVQLSSFGPMLLPVLGPMLMRRRIRRMSFREQYETMMRGIVAHPDRMPERMVEVGIANLARLTELKWRGLAFKEATTSLFEHQVGPGRRRVIRAMEQVTAPTLYIRGLEDPLVLDATTAMVRRVRPDWLVEEIEDIGHVPMVEDATWTAEHIISFVRGATITQLPVG